MGRMDFAMKDVMASSSILSTTPSSTNEVTILITTPPCVSLPARDRGQSPCPPFVSGVQLYYLCHSSGSSCRAVPIHCLFKPLISFGYYLADRPASHRSSHRDLFASRIQAEFAQQPRSTLRCLFSFQCQLDVMPTQPIVGGLIYRCRRLMYSSHIKDTDVQW